MQIDHLIYYFQFPSVASGNNATIFIYNHLILYILYFEKLVTLVLNFPYCTYLNNSTCFITFLS